MKSPFRPADKHTRCPRCLHLHAWNKNDRLGGQICTECQRFFTGHERPSYDAGQPWLDNKIQFPRLLAEIRAAGLTKEQYQVLKESMDLTHNEIDELLQRAEEVWDGVKYGEYYRSHYWSVR